MSLTLSNYMPADCLLHPLTTVTHFSFCLADRPVYCLTAIISLVKVKRRSRTGNFTYFCITIAVNESVKWPGAQTVVSTRVINIMDAGIMKCNRLHNKLNIKYYIVTLL